MFFKPAEDRRFFSTTFLILYNMVYLIKFILTILFDVVLDLNKEKEVYSIKLIISFCSIS